MKLLPADPFAGKGPGFNRQTAQVVFKTMMAMHPNEALMFGRMLIDAVNHADRMRHYVGLSKIADERAASRAAALRSHYARDAVAKARRGQDNTHELGVLVEIGKIWPFSRNALVNRANNQPRDPRGRFVAQHTTIDTDEGLAPMDQKLAQDEGIPQARLTGTTLSHYQQAHQQVSDLLAPYLHPDLSSMLHLNIEDTRGNAHRQTMRVERGKVPEFGQYLRNGHTIKSAEVSVSPQVSHAGVVHNILSAAGATPRQAAGITTGYMGLTNKENLATLGGPKLSPESPEAHSSAARAFGRIERGSRYLSDSMNEVAPPQLQFALAAANHVGQFGPEAQKVIGPFADRTAYRYRGTERAVSMRLAGSLERLHRDTDLKSPADRRRVAVTGVVTDEGWNPGPVLDYFRKHLPDADLNELQRRSGVIPPSEGIIFNRAGQVTAQSVGYADDWYLPFNLKNLADLKGGEYIRTRSFGGPTTEDIYTGLVSGARSITVVSHNGVYNIEFDPALRGGRRFNDKAARMVGRYGHLLDALRSKQVSRGAIAPSRMREIENDVARREPDRGSRAFRDELQRRMDQERLDPKLSDEQRDAAATTWLEEQADKVKTADGNPPTLQEFMAGVVNDTAKRQFLGHKEDMGGRETLYTLDDFRRAVGGTTLTGTREQVAQKIAVELGRETDLDYAIKRAAAANAERISPLSLNGKGYFDALTALQEQFPYYMEKPTYHPWSEAMGAAGASHTGALDTGYVPPRHNRPEKAEAGYFNVDVMGRAGKTDSGKVAAHTIRYQNRRVHEAPRPVGEKREEKDEGKGGGRGAGKRGEELTPERKEAQQKVADQAMLKALLEVQAFEPDAVLGTARINFGGADIRREIEAEPTRFPDANFKAIYGRDPDDVYADLADPAKASTVRRQMEAVLATKAVKVDDEVARVFRNKGEAQAVKPLPEKVEDMLREVGQEHDFSGSAYDPRGEPDLKQLVDVYGDEDTIKALVQAGHLSALEDDTFTDKAKALRRRLQDDDAEITRRVAQGRRVDPDLERENRSGAEGLLRATQLRRRYNDAIKNAPAPVAAPVQQAAVNHHQNQLVLPGFTIEAFMALPPAEQKAFLGAVQTAGGNPGLSVIGP